MHSSYRNRLSTREIAIFAMLGALMFASRVAMQALPNIHMLGLFIAAATLVFRIKALIPLYVYILLAGFYWGINIWWLPTLYVWLPLWGMFMLLGRLRLHAKWLAPIYMLAAGLHGLAFGTLFAPANALFMGLSFQGMVAWIIAGLPFDILHAVGNFAFGVLILPLSNIMRRMV